MKKHLRVLSIILAGLLAIFINGCSERTNTIVEPVIDLPTQPVTPPMQPDAVPSYTVEGSLDHQGTIRAVAFSSDGQTLASLGDNRLKLWDPHTEQLKDTLPLWGDISQRNIVQIFYISEKDIILVEEVTRGTLQSHMWSGGNTEPGDNFLTGHTSIIRSVAFGKLGFATGSSDRTIRIWGHQAAEADAIVPTFFILEHEGQVWAVAFSPDGQTLASGGGFEGIHLWDTTTGESKGPPLIAPTAQVESIAFGPNGQTLFVATGRGDGQAIHVWDLRTNQLTEILMAEGYTVRKVAISPDGQTVAGGAYDPQGPGVLLWKRK